MDSLIFGLHTRPKRVIYGVLQTGADPVCVSCVSGVFTGDNVGAERIFVSVSTAGPLLARQFGISESTLLYRSRVSPVFNR